MENGAITARLQQQGFRAVSISPNGARMDWAVTGQRRKKGVMFRAFENTNPTCCNCVLVCSGPKEKRKELMELPHSSGTVIRLEDGTEKAVPPQELEEILVKISN